MLESVLGLRDRVFIEAVKARIKNQRIEYEVMDEWKDE